MHPYVHSSSAHTDRTGDSPAALDRWTDKENALHSHSRTPLGRRNNEIMPFAATQMDLEMILNEVSQTETISCGITYICDLKYDTNEPILKTETHSLTQRSMVVTRGVRRGGTD